MPELMVRPETADLNWDFDTPHSLGVGYPFLCRIPS